MENNWKILNTDNEPICEKQFISKEEADRYLEENNIFVDLQISEKNKTLTIVEPDNFCFFVENKLSLIEI